MYSIKQSDEPILNYTRAKQKREIHLIHNVLRKYSGDYCMICRRKMNESGFCENRDKNPTVEHICSQSSHEKLINEKSNMILICSRCNNKRAKDIKEVINFNKFSNIHKLFNLSDDGKIIVNEHISDPSLLKLCLSTLIAYQEVFDECINQRKIQRLYVDRLIEQCGISYFVEMFDDVEKDIYPLYLLQKIESLDSDVYSLLKIKFEERWEKNNA